jgi:hydroxypyruvate reductase
MLEWPLDQEITLEDLRTANSALVSCGASIGEVNAVRRAFSAVKGGRLAMRAADCDQITLIISDVPRGEERNVASGPTLAPPDDAANALDVLDRYDLRDRVPEAILRAVTSDSKNPASESTGMRRHFVLLDNQTALESAAAAARHRGFITEVAQDISDQPIQSGCSQLLNRLKGMSPDAGTVCLISGGELAWEAETRKPPCVWR